jgi:hypothetical protein
LGNYAIFFSQIQICITIFYQKIKKQVDFNQKKQKITIFEQKNFGQNFAFLARSVKCNSAKFIYFFLFLSTMDKKTEIWVKKVSKTINLL